MLVYSSLKGKLPSCFQLLENGERVHSPRYFIEEINQHQKNYCFITRYIVRRMNRVDVQYIELNYSGFILHFINEKLPLYYLWFVSWGGV
jgi:hypothetical protein